jgi:hypothetical protein
LEQAPADNAPAAGDPVFGDEVDDDLVANPDDQVANALPYLSIVDPSIRPDMVAGLNPVGLVHLQAVPVEENPIDEEPIDEEPIDEQPIDEEPIDEQPIDEEPADDEVTQDELTPEEEAEIEIYRGAIFHGLDVGKEHYLDEVVLALQTYGIATDYVGGIDPTAGLGDEVEPCPFAEYYDNGFVPNPMTCELLVDLAKVEAYSELSAMLEEDSLPFPVGDDFFDEALFWRDQGAISAIEEARVFVRADIKAMGLCNQKPTPVESSYAKGVLMGRQLMAEEVNKWLEKQGHKGDYPTMSSPINVCAANTSLVDPALKSAQAAVDSVLAESPLCVGYEPPTMEDQLAFGQANIDYKKGIMQGILDEHSIAAVKVFKVVPCNVSDPLVVDLDGDGIELLPIHKGVDFDMWSTGRLQAVGWVSSDDAFLAIDRNGDGAIDAGKELFGNINEDYVDGFAEIAVLDRAENGGNGDGTVTPADSGFASLVLWQDRDTDGRSTAAELTSVASLGLVAIPTAGMPVDLRIEGNRVAAITHAESVGGPMLIGDAFLKTAPYARLAQAR